jgi:hypothetical protein
MLGGGFAIWAVRFTNYRWERMLAWFNMAEHRQDLAYQPFQSVMSFGSGELGGLGLGKGFQALYLPEAHTDFIAAIIGEELGFIGILGLCSVYLCIVARGVRTALVAEDAYGSYIAFGLSVLFGVQALINMAVAMAILPTKGLTLPFVSYGGSSLLVNATAIGVLLNISRPRLGPANLRSHPAAGGEPEASAVLATEAKYGSEAPQRRKSKLAQAVTTTIVLVAAGALAPAAGTTYGSWQEQITIRQGEARENEPARPARAGVWSGWSPDPVRSEWNTNKNLPS